MVILLFDIDGTLIRTGGAGAEAVACAVEEILPNGGPQPLEEASFQGRTDPAIFAEILADHGIAADSALLDRLFEAYLRHLPRLLAGRPAEPLPGVRETLRRLASEKRIRLGLATGNIEDGARVKLAHYGLDGYFTFGGYGSDSPRREEIVRIARDRGEALRNGGTGRPPSWVIGDTVLDIAAARAAGVRSIGVATGGSTAEALAKAGADAVLGDLSDPNRLLAILGK